MKDYYKILKIDCKATERDIKKAYRNLAMKWHPDINKNPSAHSIFIEINEAYEILINPKKRAEYDLIFSEKQHTNTSNEFKSWQEEAQKKANSYATMTIEDFKNKIIMEIKLVGSYSASFGCFIFLIFGIIINLSAVSILGPSVLVSVVVFIIVAIWLYNKSLKDYFEERRKL
ncbi:MAG: J domain-containing protein [Flavobacteriales bacterium]|nr:J domain-containing protein [Flavobacteriales bacterium]